MLCRSVSILDIIAEFDTMGGNKWSYRLITGIIEYLERRRSAGSLPPDGEDGRHGVGVGRHAVEELAHGAGLPAEHLGDP